VVLAGKRAKNIDVVERVETVFKDGIGGTTGDAASNELKPVVNKLSHGRFATEVEFRPAALHYCASNLANQKPWQNPKPTEKFLAD
jgi:hypothetical protein